MQGSRLFKIVYFLLEKGRCTAPAGFSLNAQVKAEKLVSVQNAPPQKAGSKRFCAIRWGEAGGGQNRQKK